MSEANGAARPRNLFAYAALALKGACMGAADLVPGVSGGTMALILGIYAELVNSVRGFTQPRLWRHLGRMRLKEAWRDANGAFLLVLGAGILSTIVILAEFIERALADYPVQIWSFFLGLVLASAALLGLRIARWTPGLAGLALLSALGAYWLVGLTPVSTPTQWWFLVLSGALAVCAMILPGISGSYILILLGKYYYVLAALNGRDFGVLALFIAGGIAGLLTFARVLAWLLRRCPNGTGAVLTGFMLGSVRKIWPWQARQETILANGETFEQSVIQWPPVFLEGAFQWDALIAFGFTGLGILLVVALSRLAQTEYQAAL